MSVFFLDSTKLQFFSYDDFKLLLASQITEKMQKDLYMMDHKR